MGRKSGDGSEASYSKKLAILCIGFGCVMTLISAIEFLRAFVISHSTRQLLPPNELGNTSDSAIYSLSKRIDGHMSPATSILRSQVICISVSRKSLLNFFDVSVEFPQWSPESCVCQVSFLRGKDFTELSNIWNYVMSLDRDQFYDSKQNVDIDVSDFEKSPEIVRRYLTYAFLGFPCNRLVGQYVVLSFLACFISLVWIVSAIYFSKCWLARGRERQRQKISTIA